MVIFQFVEKSTIATVWSIVFLNGLQMVATMASCTVCLPPKSPPVGLCGTLDNASKHAPGVRSSLGASFLSSPWVLAATTAWRLDIKDFETTKS